MPPQSGCAHAALPSSRRQASGPHVLRAPAVGSDSREVIKLMRSAGVQPTFHYVPLHSAPGASELADSDDTFRYRRHQWTATRMPFFNELTEHEQEKVALALVEAVEASILSTAT